MKWWNAIRGAARLRRLSGQTMRTVQAMVDQDVATAAAGIHKIMEAGPDAVFTACCVWAELVRKLALPRRATVNSFYTWSMVDQMTGEVVCPDGLGPAMHAPVWATRFVMAVANRDTATAGALLAVDAADPDQWWDNVVYLLALAAAAVRHRVEGRERG